ncbi:hypothetical protein P7C70_g7659, partial [Phenoliferia sp. Uapishka_3]
TTAHHLPFPIRQSLWLPTLLPLSPTDISLAVIDERGEVVLVGEAVADAFSKPVKASRLPTASSGQSRLFDEIFGGESAVANVAPVPAKKERSTPSVPKSLEVLDAPSHTLPAPRMLWKSMLGAFAVTGKQVTKDNEAEVDGMEVDEKEVSEKSRPQLVFSPVESLADIFQARMSLSEPLRLYSGGGS